MNTASQTRGQQQAQPVDLPLQHTIYMTPNIDIVKDFSVLQARCTELGDSNIRFVRENERLKKDLSYLTATLRSVRFLAYQSAELRKTVESLSNDKGH